MLSKAPLRRRRAALSEFYRRGQPTWQDSRSSCGTEREPWSSDMRTNFRRTRSSGLAIMAAFCLNILNHDNQTVIRGGQ
jgi:hypothetical protein